MTKLSKKLGTFPSEETDNKRETHQINQQTIPLRDKSNGQF